MASVKKNSDTLYKCTLFSPEGQISHKCQILKVIDQISVYIRYKKPRSSKYARKYVPWNKIIAFSAGSKDSKEEGFISYMSQRVPLASVRPFKGYIEVDEKTGMYTVVSDEDVVYTVRPDCIDATADEESDAVPEKKVVSKKK